MSESLPTVKVLSYEEASDYLRTTWTPAVISIRNPTGPRLADIESVEDRLELEFNDTIFAASVDRVPPKPADVEKIIDFAKYLVEKPDPPSRLLIHCAAGISRSAAAAVICQSIWLGPGQETEALISVYEGRDLAAPNALMIEIADELLGRQGRLYAKFLELPDAEDYYHLKRIGYYAKRR